MDFHPWAPHIDLGTDAPPRFSLGDVNNFDSADKSVKITKTQKGQMLGNSIPVPLMGHVLAEAMWAAGLVASMPDTSNLSRFLD